MNASEGSKSLVKLKRLPAPDNCSLHAAIFAQEGLDVPTAEIEHYAQLWGRKVTMISFQSYKGSVLPVIEFSGGISSAVYCDPECNAPGFLGIDWVI